ncbi:hypothetical protein [Microcoleus sp.]
MGEWMRSHFLTNSKGAIAFYFRFRNKGRWRDIQFVLHYCTSVY